VNRGVERRHRHTAIDPEATLAYTVLAHLATTGSTLSATELASALSYQRRPVAIALESLVQTHVLDELSGAGRATYRLCKPQALADFIGAWAPQLLHWPTAFKVLAEISDVLQNHDELSGVSAIVVISKFYQRNIDALKHLRVEAPSWLGEPEKDRKRFADFTLQFAETLQNISAADHAISRPVSGAAHLSTNKARPYRRHLSR